jgi:hypothetical protein
MGRLSTLAFAGVLAWAMAGCGSNSQVNNVPTPSAPEVVKKQPAAKPLAESPGAALKPVAAIYSSSGLIQSTNPQQRAKQVEKGRLDPFALLPGQAVALVLPTATAKSIVPRLPSLPAKPVNRNIGMRQARILPPVPSSALPPVLPPPPPQADLARGVAVTGVVEVGNESQAIVKVPNEVTSRYVREGQRLSNGQVLVKRIEVNEGSNPVVVLEQNGIEVDRAVGEEPVKSGETSKTTGIPGSPSPGNTRSSPDR